MYLYRSVASASPSGDTDGGGNGKERQDQVTTYLIDRIRIFWIDIVVNFSNKSSPLVFKRFKSIEIILSFSRKE